MQPHTTMWWHGSRSGRQRAATLHILLGVLLLLLCCGHGCSAAHQSALATTDRDMGIHTYSSMLQHGKHLLDVRMQLRFLCNNTPGSAGREPASGSGSGSGGAAHGDAASVVVLGFVSIFPFSTKPPSWSLVAPHYVPVNLQGAHRPNISITSSHSRRAPTQLEWVGPSDVGLWRAEAQLSGPGPFQLHVSGADSLHQLPQPLCVQQPGAAAMDAKLAGGLWNVLTTTSDSSIRPAALAQLVREHNSYHRQLGFSGTILRSNRIESEALLAMPGVQQAVEQEGLIVWPWEQEHVATASTHYWQRPKNQLTLLAAYGRGGARLAFFDLDEYLVIHDAATRDVASARCDGRPLLDVVAPPPPPPLLPAVTAGHRGLASSRSSSSKGGSVLQEQHQHQQQREMGSWVFIRYQAKSCPEADGDQTCWARGAPFSSGAAVTLLHDLCPMSQSHGKHILTADAVDTLSVHATFSRSAAGNAVVNASCAHLLHFYSLLEARRPGITGMLRTLPPARWDPVVVAGGPGGGGASSGRRQVQWPQGLAPLDFEACQASRTARMDAVRRFQAQQRAARGPGGNSGASGAGPAAAGGGTPAGGGAAAAAAAATRRRGHHAAAVGGGGAATHGSGSDY